MMLVLLLESSRMTDFEILMVVISIIGLILISNNQTSDRVPEWLLLGNLKFSHHLEPAQWPTC